MRPSYERHGVIDFAVLTDPLFRVLLPVSWIFNAKSKSELERLYSFE